MKKKQMPQFLLLVKQANLVKNISKETMKKYPNIEWIIIKNLRNKIVHDYEGIKLNFIWDVIKNDILKLRKDIQAILDDCKE